MKLSTAFHLAIFFTSVVVLPSRDARQIQEVQAQSAEERDFVTRAEFKSYLAQKDNQVGPIMELAKASLGGIATLSAVNYTLSGGEVAWAVSQAVVPIIGAALALIPGVGPVVSGLFLGMWSLISPIFAPKTDNPMEKMIVEMNAKIQQNMDNKLKDIIKRAIYGEIVRNNYICSKYSFISRYFSKQLESNTSLQAIDALKLMVYLDNCDNFLKDTAEAFVYDEYANVLWVPAAITTSTRLGFLTELIKYGHLLGMKRNVTAIYFQELEKDIKRQFQFYYKGMKLLLDVARKGSYSAKTNYFADITLTEKAACQLQSQFFYFDRKLYPYGIPKVLNNTDMFADIKMEDHYTPSRKFSEVHLQVFFNVTSSKYPGKAIGTKAKFPALEFMNCFMGPMFLTAPSTFYFNFYRVPHSSFSHEFRVIYFQKYSYHDGHEEAVPLLTELKKPSDKFESYKAIHNAVHKDNALMTKDCLSIEFVFPSDPKAKESEELIDVPGVAHWKTCPYERGHNDVTLCNTYVKFFHGRFKMYSAGIYQEDYDYLNPLIAIGSPLERSVQESGRTGQPQQAGFLMGLEIILRRKIY